MSAEHSLKALEKLINEWLESAPKGSETPERIMRATVILTEIKHTLASPLMRLDSIAPSLVIGLQQKVSRFVVEGCEKYPGQLIRTEEEMQNIRAFLADVEAFKGGQMLHFSQLQNPDHWYVESAEDAKPPAVIHTWKLQPQDVTACMN
jgi:hypothetical protein